MPSLRWPATARVILALTLAALAPLAPALPAGAREVRSGYERRISITFPVKGRVSYSDTYHAARGSTRVHQATDIMARKMQRVYAVRNGVVCYITGVAEKVPTYGYMLTLCGSDGRRYNYLHLNNDTPGTDDGKGGVEYAYAKNLVAGTSVVRGQFLGFVGDSGNAEVTAPHLHFEIEDEALEDPRIVKQLYDPIRINPYYSLRRAEARQDYPGNLYPREDAPSSS